MTLWTPSDLATLPTHWWDASDVPTLTLNSGRVAAWANKGSAGGDVNQVASAEQPSYGVSTINGVSVVTNSNTTEFGNGFSVPNTFRLYVLARFSAADTAQAILSAGPGSVATFVPLAQSGSTVTSVSRVNAVDVIAPQTFHINGSPTVVNNRGAVHTAITGTERIVAIRNVAGFTNFGLFRTDNIAFRPSADFGEILLVPEAGLTQASDELITG